MATDSKSKAMDGNKFNKKRKHYLPHNKPVKKKGSYPLRPGVEGFFITCDGGREFQASHEALNVLDSFFEDLVQGEKSNSQTAEPLKQSVNKKIKFVYSDSSEDEEEEGDVEENEDKSENRNEPKDVPVIDDVGEAKDGASFIKKLGTEKEDEQSHEDQKNEKNSEESSIHENQIADAGEPTSKKPRVETVAVTCPTSESSKVEKSIDKLIEAELAEMGDKSKRRFNKLDSGCNGVIFIQMRKRDGDPSPKDIVQYIMTSLASTRKHVSRFMLRVLPIEVTCYASEEEITRAIKPLVTQYFPVETEHPQKFAVLYEARSNTGIDRMKIINAVAKAVPQPHTVNLSNPDKHIIVEIVKTLCLIGVVDKYKELAKFNMRQLTSAK